MAPRKVLTGAWDTATAFQARLATEARRAYLAYSLVASQQKASVQLGHHQTNFSIPETAGVVAPSNTKGKIGVAVIPPY